MPKPWGVTALFAEYTGQPRALDVDWSLERDARTIVDTVRVAEPLVEPIAIDEVPFVQELSEGERDAVPPAPFVSFWEFAVALNRSDPAALALAGDGATSDVPMDGVELRRLLGMMWFRTVLSRLSHSWRDRILDALVDSVTMPDHLVKHGRQIWHLRDLTFDQLQEITARTMVPERMRADLDLLMTVGRHWGPDAVRRFRFVEAPEPREPSMVESLLERFRG
jgi:hypothetical protein